jgi:tripartite-type tricarboxylate transporter receptor subunit TctC
MEASMELRFRHFRCVISLTIALAGVSAGLTSTCLGNDAWPSRAVKIIVPFAAGSANDVSARFYADGLTTRWGKPVVIENRPGADAIVGGGAFANARDDHTLLYGTASMVTVSPLLQDVLPYDPSRDMMPISSTASSILVIAVHDRLPVRSLQELAQLARSKPGELSWSSGPSLPHFVMAAMLARHALRQVYIPYRDATTQQADFGEGRVQILSHALLAVRATVAAGKARILAVTSPQREPGLPDVPTVAEAGFPEMEIEGLAGLFGWRDMPTALRDRISADVRAVAADPSVRSRIEASGSHVLGSTPGEFAAAIERQRTRIEHIGRIVDLRNAAKL